MNANEALTSLGPFNRFMSGPIRAVLAASGFLSVALWICAALPTTRVTASDLGFALLVTLVFVLAELFPAEIEIRRESIRFSFSVVPLILALFGLPALLVVAARSAASVLTFFVIRREVWFKSYSNVASQILEVAVAAILISSFRPPGAFGVGSWLLAGCAVLAADLVSSLSIGLTISAYLGAWDPNILSGLFFGFAIGTVDLMVAIVTITLYEFGSPAAGLAILVGLVLFATVSALARVTERYKALEMLDRFTQNLGTAVLSGRVIEGLLAEAGEIMHAEKAWLLAGHQHHLARFRLDDEATVREVPTELDLALTTGLGEAGQMFAVSGLVSSEATEGFEQVMIARIRSDEADPLYLVVADRSGAVRSFDAGDLRLFETLAAHAGIALQNVGLVDRLRREIEVTDHLAAHDSLTGLPNRNRFNKTLDAAIAEKESVAVLLIDLDRFKDVNDTLGHHNGDRLLVEVGRRLSQLIKAPNLVARLGGDEFAVLLTDSATEAEVIRWGLEIAEELEQPFQLADLEVQAGASIGGALRTPAANDGPTLLRQADVAMYSAKGDHSQIELYAPHRDHYSPERLAMVGKLRAAIERRELTLHYQPQIDLATGEVVGAEALVRWLQPDGTMVAPDDFIGVAEHTGLIRPLTHLVLEMSIEQGARWYRQGHRFQISVNFSPNNMVQRSLAADVGRLLEQAGLPPQYLMVELTETTVMGNPGRTIEIMNALRSLGVNLSIDDFGTGHSSLSYLTGLPATEIKIDKSFVFAMETDPTAATVVRAIVDLGRSLGLLVVAEGVESAELASRLREMQCAVAQGYHFSRPLPVREFERWLAERAGAEVDQWVSGQSIEHTAQVVAPKS